jgi:GST-like protein
MLAVIGLPYTVRLVDLAVTAKFAPEFLAISLNSNIPALIDRDGTGRRCVLVEGGAVLTYLAEKSRRLLASARHRRDEPLLWLFWSTPGLGPALGVLLQRAATPNSQSRPEELGRAIIRLMRVLETFAGEYSVADVAAFAWLKPALPATRTRLNRLTNLGEKHCRLTWPRCGRRVASCAQPHQHALTEGCTS